MYGEAAFHPTNQAEPGAQLLLPSFFSSTQGVLADDVNNPLSDRPDTGCRLPHQKAPPRNVPVVNLRITTIKQARASKLFVVLF